MNLVVAVTFLSLVNVVGRSTTFWIYGVITICARIFIYKLVPERVSAEHNLESSEPVGSMAKFELKRKRNATLLDSSSSEALPSPDFGEGVETRRAAPKPPEEGW